MMFTFWKCLEEVVQRVFAHYFLKGFFKGKDFTLKFSRLKDSSDDCWLADQIVNVEEVKAVVSLVMKEVFR